MQNLAKEAETYQNSKKAPKPIEQAYYLQNYNPLKKKKAHEEEFSLVHGSSVHTSNQGIETLDPKKTGKRELSPKGKDLGKQEAATIEEMKLLKIVKHLPKNEE